MSNNKIYSTKDLTQFKYLKGNRSIHEPWVRKLAELIKDKDLQIPIVVDENMKVQDGQHRLEAYKLCGFPISYIIKEKFALEDVRALNANSKKWSLTDYLMSHVKLGNTEYKLLEWFVKTYDMPILWSVAMLNGKGFFDSKITRTFKNGEFVICDLEWGKEQARRLAWVGEFFQYNKKKNFIAAMLAVFRDKTFKWETFKKRLENNSAKLKNQGSRNDFIVNIERIYNTGTSEKNKIRLELYDYKR
jgi:hypothetical protein